MKVLHIFPVHEIGGAETVSMNLMRFRRRDDIEHEAILVSNDDGALGAELSRMGIPWTRVLRGRMRNPRDLWKAASALRQHVLARSPDVFLSNSAQGFLYGRLATIGRGVSGALYQMSVPSDRWWRNGPLDWLAAAAQPEIVFAASAAIGRRVAGWSIAPVQTVYHGAPVPKCEPAALACVQHELHALGVDADAPVVLMPGRLQAWKGQRVFLAAFAEVLAEFPTAHAVCLGSALFGLEAAYPQQLADEVRARGLEKRFHFVPHQGVAPWLERATIVVHASLSADAFPNVCIEALACRRALITNTLSGTAEIVEHLKDAMVVPPADHLALSAAIQYLLRDPGKRAEMAEAGHAAYLLNCTPAHMVDAIESGLSRITELAQARGKRAA